MDRTHMKRWMAASLAFLLPACGMIEVIPQPARNENVTPEVSNVLLRLIDNQEKETVTAVDYNATSLGVISTLKTPAGIRLRLRYEVLSISLVEALKLTRDQDLLARLLELAKWSQNQRVRAEALVTLAAFSTPADLAHFRSALTDQDIAIRFAAVEALQKWGQPEALALLKEAEKDPWSPLIRVFAAQAAVSLGDADGLTVLRSALDDRSWTVRALAARYLGDYASPDDEALLLKVVNQETRNDFVAVEAAIAALKLLAKKSATPVPLPTRQAKDTGNGDYTVSADDVVEMEPLVIRPPRLSLPESVRVAQSLNNRLIQLIKTRLDVPLDASLKDDPNLADLDKMVTPEGFALQTRYSGLSVAVAEGLAGTTDPLLRSELTLLAESSRSETARATALVSLAYARDKRDLPLIMRALTSESSIIRFGAMEAAQAGRFKDTVPDLLGVAASDPVPIFRLYAAQALLEFGEPSADSLLISHESDKDWPSRAMTYWLKGRYGKETDYAYLLGKLSSEDNPFVVAELALAIQRLAPAR